MEFGICGQKLTWTLDDEGTLIIGGTGEMHNYNPRWRDNELIKKNHHD